MKKKHLPIVFFSFLTFSVFAQKEDLSSEKPLEELTVTANRFSQKISETAKNVTVISKEELERSKGLSVAQLLQNQVGMMVVGANNNPGTPIFVNIRGASRGNTLILLDGVPVNDPSEIAMSFDLNMISAEQLSRIEIVKNSQSTLYGSDAVAGVINLISKPDTDMKKLNNHVSLQGGSFGTLKSTVGFKAGTERLYAQLHFNSQRTNGISDAAKSPLISSSTPFEKDKSNFRGLMATVGGLHNLMNWKLVFLSGQQNGSLDDGAFRDEKDYTFKNKYNSLTGSYGISLKRLLLVSNAKIDFNNRFYKNDSTWVASDAFTKYFTNEFKGASFFVESYGAFKINKYFRGLIGVDVRSSRITQNDNYDGFLTSIKDSSVSMLSTYAMLYLQNTGNFVAELGGRLNFHETYGKNATFSFSPAYNFDKHTRVFLNVSSGFKAPSLYQLYSPYGNKDLRPEESVTGDIGVAYKKDEWSAKAAYFVRNTKNGIFFQNLAAAPYGKYINLNQQKDNGLEVEATYKFSKLGLFTNYTFVTGNITTKNTYERDTTYNNLFRRPQHSFNLGLTYQVSDAFFIKLNERLVGTRYDLFFNDQTFGTEKIKLTPYLLIDVYMEYAFSKGLKAFVQVNNILNQKYYDIYGFNTRPVNFMLGVSTKF